MAVFARLARHPALRAGGPVLAGTFPLGLDVEGSDLDVIVYAPNPARFAARLTRAFVHRPGFRLRLRNVGGLPTVVARFREEGFPVEVFAQARPAGMQRAVRHLRIEARLLRLAGAELGRCVRALKARGVKTEPAFARCLGLEGDPYQTLLAMERWDGRTLARWLASDARGRAYPL